jgi:TonB family protein
MAESYEHLVEEKTALAQDNHRNAANLVLTNLEKDRLAEEKTTIQDDLTRAGEYYDQLKTKNTSLLAAQADLKNQAAFLQRNDSKLRDEVAALTTTIVKLATTRDSSAEKNARTAQAAKSLAAELATERQGKDRLAKEKAALDDRFIKSQEQRAQLVAKKAELTNANTSLEGQIAALRQNDNDDRRQRAALKAAITQLTQSRDRLIDQNVELVTRLEISDEEAAALRAQNEQTTQSAQPSAAALDTGNALRESDPRPVAGNPKPVYPRLAIRRGLEGEVSLAVSVSASGEVSGISISKPSGSKLLDQAALKAVRQWQFTPAIKDGTASPATTTIPVQFRLLNRVNS